MIYFFLWVITDMGEAETLEKEFLVGGGRGGGVVNAQLLWRSVCILVRW